MSAEARIFRYLSSPPQASYHPLLLLLICTLRPKWVASRRAVGSNPTTYEFRIPLESILEGLSTALKVIAKAGYSTRRRDGQAHARAYKSRNGADRDRYFSEQAKKAFQTLKSRGPLQNLGGTLSQCGTEIIVDEKFELAIRRLHTMIIDFEIRNMALMLCQWTPANSKHNFTHAKTTCKKSINLPRGVTTSFARKLHPPLVCAYSGAQLNANCQMDHVLGWKLVGATGHHSGNLLPIAGALNGAAGKWDRLPDADAWSAIRNYYTANPSVVAAIKADMQSGGSMGVSVQWSDWFDYVDDEYDGMAGVESWGPVLGVHDLQASEISQIHNHLKAIRGL